jgi:uncharacterized damage-inducible protein DinB
MPLSPEHALLLRDSALRSFKSEQAVTQRVIEAIPAGKADYRPDDVGKTALELAWHIVGAEHRFVDAVITGAFDFTNTGKPADLGDTAAVARWYAETLSSDLERLAALPAAALVKSIDFRGLFTFPAVNFLDVGLKHSIHHRGQLTMYLRPMGAKVPAIYGESYDSARAKQAGV